MTTIGFEEKLWKFGDKVEVHSIDILLRGKKLNFWIDKIAHYKDNEFLVTILPNINSKFFPPFHMRNIRVNAELLEKNFLRNVNGYEDTDIISVGSVIQGGYYSVDTDKIISQNIFNFEYYVVDITNDFFKDFLTDSPINDKDYSYSNCYEEFLLENKNSNDCMKPHVYCFNVGQGDSSLVITSLGNAYLVDTNIYDKNRAHEFCLKVYEILESHNLDSTKIKGLIITHKHIDHLRGASHIIKNKYFDIEYFLINHDYKHETKAVCDLLDEAEAIPKWLNLNAPCSLIEGSTSLEFINPDYLTATNVAAPDINDSSICISVSYHDSCMHLIGDIGYNHLLGKTKSFLSTALKISHHGSDTGTDEKLLNQIKPEYSFISAGTHKGYNHPHLTVTNLLKTYVSNNTVSKEVKRTTCYKLNGSGISKSYR